MQYSNYNNNYNGCCDVLSMMTWTFTFTIDVKETHCCQDSSYNVDVKTIVIVRFSDRA